jgi:hypothetical protein
MTMFVVRLLNASLYSEPVFVSEKLEFCRKVAEQLKAQHTEIGHPVQQYRIEKVETITTTQTVEEAVAEAKNANV